MTQVTDEDRRAVVAYLSSTPTDDISLASLIVKIQQGKADNHPLVQAFARHRIAERERCAEIAEIHGCRLLAQAIREQSNGA